MYKKRIEIDQSGKIEQTNLDTVVALTNGIKYTILFKKREKRILEKNVKTIKVSKTYSPTVFAILIAIVIKESKVNKSILIDTEYSGHNKLINQKIKSVLNNLKVKHIPVIKFGFVGKESKSDYLASKTRLGKVKPSKIIKAIEIIKFS